MVRRDPGTSRAAERLVEELRVELRASIHQRHLLAEQLRHEQDRNSALVNLHVAASRLLEVETLEALHVVLGDIASEMLGSDDLAVYEVLPDRHFRLAFFVGETAPRLGTGVEWLRPVADGSVVITPGRGASGEPAGSPLACIPLGRSGSPEALLAIFRLRPQKLALCAADRELLAFLAEYAGRVLSRLRPGERG
jgi:hypothetical protein